jgi:CRP-like cAMP-binding protein
MGEYPVLEISNQEKTMPVDVSIYKSALPYRGFTEEDWTVLSNTFTEVPVKAGSVIFKENAPGDGFYWVRAGKVRISRQVVQEGKTKAQEQLLTLLTAGNIFVKRPDRRMPSRKATR